MDADLEPQARSGPDTARPARPAAPQAPPRPVLRVPGTATPASPPPGFFSASPVITTSWQAAPFTVTGGIGFWIAFSHAGPISSSDTPMPSA